ncbi:MAG: hypothetical protein AMJ92_03580 [candidate division Zixibacteria bacterium SM23_81]|nr:MAG: hypothetical protein AMJ92_03580 [candidate division Zixibacteria bacterium SM23_81]
MSIGGTNGMRRLLAYLLVTLLLAVAGCQHSNPVKGPSPAAKEIILFDDHNAITLATDAATIEEASLQRDFLRLQVAYGGGCRKHDFKLYGSTSFMESYPVQTKIYLSHDAHGDRCKALVRDEMIFDLSPLKQAYRYMYRTGMGPIRLRIYEPGLREQHRILYEF